MKIIVKLKPNSKIKKIEKTGDRAYSIRIKEPATENKANLGLIKALADYFDVSKSQIEIISGLTSRQKIVEITGLASSPDQAPRFP